MHDLRCSRNKNSWEYNFRDHEFKKEILVHTLAGVIQVERLLKPSCFIKKASRSPIPY